MIVAAIAVVATGWIALVLGACHRMAPKTDEERRADDEAQMRAVAKRRMPWPYDGMTYGEALGTDDCDPHGINLYEIIKAAQP